MTFNLTDKQISLIHQSLTLWANDTETLVRKTALNDETSSRIAAALMAQIVTIRDLAEQIEGSQIEVRI